MKLGNLFLAIFALMAASCATYHQVSSDTPENELTRLVPKRGVNVVSVDNSLLGTFAGIFGSTVHLAPGNHTLSLEFDQIFFRSLGEASLRIQARPGEILYICPKVDYFARQWQPFATRSEDCTP